VRTEHSPRTGRAPFRRGRNCRTSNKMMEMVLRHTEARENRHGEGGIRTPGDLRHGCFQDSCIRPLCHLSADALIIPTTASRVNWITELAGELMQWMNSSCTFPVNRVEAGTTRHRPAQTTLAQSAKADFALWLP
jgi:hypothetical protein